MPINYTCFNELCCPPGKLNAGELRALLLKFVPLVHTAWKMGLRRLRVMNSFRDIPTADGSTMLATICSLPHSERNILLRAADAPHIRDDDKPEHVNTYLSLKIESVENVSVSEAEGCLCAHVTQALAASLPSSIMWDKNQLQIEVSNNPDGNTLSATIPHASTLDHLEAHVAMIGRAAFDVEKYPPTEKRPLPNSKFVTEYYAKMNWEKLMVRLNATPASEKIGAIEAVAAAVATLNGYSLDAELTALNKQRSKSWRQIFSYSGATGTMYLSTDFEKGAFEVCDSLGRHSGEWLFSGVQHKSADESGRHSIWLE